jgi:hypothetical protein
MNKHQLEQDRALRNSARALIKADIAHVRTLFGGASLGKRALSRVSDGASEVFEQASESASSHRGALIALLSAVGLWFARNPIMAMFEDEDELADEQVSGVEDSSEGAVEIGASDER